MIRLKLISISKSFDGKKILNNIDIDIKNNERLCIIGPSGAGKTTLLRCISLLDTPNNGSIAINNKEIYSEGKVSNLKYLRNKISMVFQSFNLWQNKTSLENIIEGLVIVKKLSYKKAVKIGKKLLNDVGLKDKSDNYPFSLSGGEQQRVAIARALAMNPKILLLDEITSSLDVESIRGILKLIKKLSKKDIVLIVVTHEINFAKEIADKVIFLDKGKIIENGTVDDVLTHSKNPRLMRFLSGMLK